MERYRLYLDESGDHVYHDERRLHETGHRYLALVGCWFRQGQEYLEFQRGLEELKQRHFPHSPDDPVILHRKEVVDSVGPFWRLRGREERVRFEADLCDLISAARFHLVGVCIDKLLMKQHYSDPWHPYHVALDFVLQRYCGWLNHANRSGDVLAESRGGEEDRKLRTAYSHIWRHGDRYHRADFFQRALTSREVKLKKKSENIAGLQLADLLAHAVRDDILVDCGRIQVCCPFDERLLRVTRAKYNHQPYDGRVQGYGKLMFPK